MECAFVEKRENVTSKDQDADEEMGIPLATEESVNNSAKRDAEELLEDEPTAQRRRLDFMNVVEPEFEVCELFSRPRVCPVAQEIGLKPGYSLDSTWMDDTTQQQWDLRSGRTQRDLWKLLKLQRPRLLVVSAPYLRFSTEKEMQEDGSTFLKIAILACWSQLKAGQYFILELPTFAARWKAEDLQRLAKEPSITEIVLDQCAYGLVSCDGLGWAPVKKSTKLLTNVQCAQELLGRRCSRDHRHVQSVHGSVQTPERYPRELCKAFLKALQVEMAHASEVHTVQEPMVFNDTLHEESQEVNIEKSPQWDENIGCRLDPTKVR